MEVGTSKEQAQDLVQDAKKETFLPNLRDLRLKKLGRSAESSIDPESNKGLTDLDPTVNDKKKSNEKISVIAKQSETEESQAKIPQIECSHSHASEEVMGNVPSITKAPAQHETLNETSAPEATAAHLTKGSLSAPENFRVVLAGSAEEIHTVQHKRRKIQLEAPDVGPKFYDIQGNFVSPPLIPARLPESFESLPVFGEPGTMLDQNKTKMLWEFVGPDMEEEEFDKLGMYCSTENLRTGYELSMPTKDPRPGGPGQQKTLPPEVAASAAQLRTVRRHQVLAKRDKNNTLGKRHKYRGVRFLNMEADAPEPEIEMEPPLVPGKDLLFRVRIYRPFRYSPREKKISQSGRHPVYVCDLVIPGRHRLSRLRDRLACVNDEGMRHDMSECPEESPSNCKELFPSGFLFINNVFYNDTRSGCHDYSAPIREWAQRRGIGTFPARDLTAVRLDELTIRLGYPEVYVHQGSCEHLFTFADVRLVGLNDPLRASLYPAHRSAASYNCVYCTTCAEYPADWVVTGCSRVPFDPALFCDSCFRLYMYVDGVKCGEFKAMQFKGNQLDITLMA